MCACWILKRKGEEEWERERREREKGERGERIEGEKEKWHLL